LLILIFYVVHGANWAKPKEHYIAMLYQVMAIYLSENIIFHELGDNLTLHLYHSEIVTRNLIHEF